MEKWAAPAVWSLLLLDIFETPQWCKSYPESSGCRTAGGQDYMLSGVPLVPLALAAAWEGVVLLLLCVHFVSHVRLYSKVRGHGHATTPQMLIIEGSLLVLSLVDLLHDLYGSSVRLAPLLRPGSKQFQHISTQLDRFGLAACSVPRLQESLRRAVCVVLTCNDTRSWFAPSSERPWR